MAKKARAERPHMQDYGIHTSRQGLLDRSFVSERMAARNSWVASCGQDDRPYVAPVCGLSHQGAFFFSTGDESRKVQNLRADLDTVVHLESSEEVVRCDGSRESQGYHRERIL